MARVDDRIHHMLVTGRTRDIEQGVAPGVDVLLFQQLHQLCSFDHSARS
jgi:hypothetical protein